MENENYLAYAFSSLMQQATMKQIVQLNEETLQFRLALTPTDAAALIETRNHSLRANGRVEIGSTVITKIIHAFCDSVYINQREYVQILNDLIETFYHMKNETLDLISDDELIDLMKEYYEKSCFGSMDLLQHRELEKLAHNLRFGVANYSDVVEAKPVVIDNDDEEDN